MRGLIVACAHFHRASEDSAARLCRLMMLFMAAMLGVMLSDNIRMLFNLRKLATLTESNDEFCRDAQDPAFN
jgi:multicomponent K+:H+ antiporter subunit A